MTDPQLPARPAPVSRRHVLLGGAGALALGATAVPGPSWAAPRGVAQVHRGRATLTSGVQTGDVTTRSGTLWARSSQPGRLVARVATGRSSRVVRGPWATPDSDLTARIDLDGLAPGREHVAQLWFEGEDGRPGEIGTARFSTAGVHPGRRRSCGPATPPARAGGSTPTSAA